MKTLLLFLLLTVPVQAKGHGHISTHHAAPYHRSAAAKASFQRANPCPANGATSGGCKGFVIDHIKPLACGGADAPSNMQWETIAEGKAKDKWERKGKDVVLLGANTIYEHKTAGYIEIKPMEQAKAFAKATRRFGAGVTCSLTQPQLTSVHQSKDGASKTGTGAGAGDITYSRMGEKHSVKR